MQWRARLIVQPIGLNTLLQLNSLDFESPQLLDRCENKGRHYLNPRPSSLLPFDHTHEYILKGKVSGLKWTGCESRSHRHQTLWHCDVAPCDGGWRRRVGKGKGCIENGRKLLQQDQTLIEFSKAAICMVSRVYLLSVHCVLPCPSQHALHCLVLLAINWNSIIICDTGIVWQCCVNNH